MGSLRGSNFVVAALVAAVGCGTGVTNPGHDAGPDGSSGAGGDAGDAGNGCNGICVPGQANGFDYPGFIWFGAEKDAPQCPDYASNLGYEGHADLDAPFTCDSCTCSTPTGSCGLPSQMTANAASCALNGTSTPHTPFDPATGWDGTCDTNDSIPSGKLCSGVKCVQSLSIGPLSVLNESPCTPSQSTTPPPATWKTFVRGCRHLPYESCPDGPGLCNPAPQPGSGFRICMFHNNDVDCPSFSPYSEKHVAYDDFMDTRACSPCTCGTPSGGKCSSAISIYADGACSTAPLVTPIVDSTGTTCLDLPAGTPLGSKSVAPASYSPGACQPGGGMPTGAATPTNPSTFCCLPSP